MKSVLIIEHGDRHPEDAVRLLREHGYIVEPAMPDTAPPPETEPASAFSAPCPAGKAEIGKASSQPGWSDVAGIHSSPCAIMIARASDGAILDCNRSVDELTGYGREEMVGQNILNLFFFLDPEQWSRTFRKLKTEGEIRDIGSRMWTKFGLVVFVLVSIKRVEIDGVPCHVITVRELSPFAAFEAENVQTDWVNAGQDNMSLPGIDFNREEIGRLIDFKALQDLMNSFYKVTHIGMAITDVQGNVQVATGWQDVCTRFHRMHPETMKNCLESDIHLSRELGRGEAIYKCKNGMWDMATPLIIGDRHIANIFLGQFFFEGEAPDYEFFRKQAETYGFDAEEYLAAVDRVPRWSRELVWNVMEFYGKLALIISRLSIGNIQLSQALTSQKRIFEELRRTKLVVENSPVVLFRWRAEEGWPVEFVSKNVIRFGYTPEELLSGATPFSSMIHPGDLERVASEVAEHVGSGAESFQQEYRIVTRDGSIRWVDDRTVIERDAEGRVTHYQGTVLDVSERKRAEAALKENEERMRLYFERQLVGMAITSPQKGWLQVNDKLCRMLGYGREELERLTWEEMTHPDDLAADRDSFQRLLDGGIDDYSMEKRFIRKDGATVYTNMSVGCVRDENGSVDYVLALLEDITERNAAEEALRLSERRYRDIVENAPIGIFRSTFDGRFLVVNPALARILGFKSAEELIESVNQRGVADVVYARPEQRKEILGRSLSTHEWTVSEVEFRRGEGVVTVNMHYRCVPGGAAEVIEFEGFIEDIGERKKAENALRESEERFRTLFMSLSEGFYLSEPIFDDKGNPCDYRYLEINPTFERIVGVSRDQIIGKRYRELVAVDTTRWLENYFRVVLTGEPCRFDFYSDEFRRYFETYAYKTTKGRISVIVIDVTERKWAEKALRESEEKFRVLAETLPTAIMLHQGGKFLYVNPATTLITGYSETELLEMNFWEWCREEDWDAIRERGRARLRGATEPFQYEYRLRMKGGEEKWVMVSVGIIEYEGSPTAIATLLDITETKHAEEKMQTALSEKIVLLKEVHHRVKNNLQIICSLLDLQADSIPDEQSRGYFRECQNRVRSMALVHERIYRSTDFSSIDFGEYLRDLSQQLFDSYLVNTDRIALNVGGDPEVVLGVNEAIPCGLIVNELVSNSLQHAFPANGSGKISIDFHLMKDMKGDGISLTVADNGVGLPDCFDFRDTGSLGLQLVSMLVKQLGGRLSVGAGQVGTVMSITFPVTARK